MTSVHLVLQKGHLLKCKRTIQQEEEKDFCVCVGGGGGGRGRNNLIIFPHFPKGITLRKESAPLNLFLESLDYTNFIVYKQRDKTKVIIICSIKGLAFGSKEYTKELKTVECTSFLGQTS